MPRREATSKTVTALPGSSASSRQGSLSSSDSSCSLRFRASTRRGSGAETEAQIVTQQFETAQFFPPAARAPLSGELVCYARTVIHQEWPQMQAGTLGDTVNLWGVATFRTLKTVEPRSASEQAAFAKWLDQRSDRETARAERNHGAEGVIPVPLWIVLLLSAAVIFGTCLRRQR